MHPARLFVLCGLPGAGKTTRAIELAERFGAVRLSADDVMEAAAIDIWDAAVRAAIESSQRDTAAQLLRAGQSVVVEWGSWTRVERDELLGVARTAGASAHLELLDAPIEVLWERVRGRAREQLVGSRAITLDDMRAWSATIERPTADELRRFDPWPPVRAGERPGSPAYPYGTWAP